MVCNMTSLSANLALSANRFSANLGFLWTEYPLPDAIHAAHAAGFDAVECHWPYDTDPAEVVAALQATGLTMLGLNAARGDVEAGENGLAALVGRTQDAQRSIDKAIAYAEAIDAGYVHVLAGVAYGPEAEGVFIDNLRYATSKAAACGRMIVIEPLNGGDAPGYFLNHTDLARRIIKAVGSTNLKLMFDCYHVQLLEGDLIRRISANIDLIGHVQFAGVPYRGHPDKGELDYADVFAHLAALGYDAPLGAEYRPDNGNTDASLGWMSALRHR